MKKSAITYISAYVPSLHLTNNDIESRINVHGQPLKKSFLKNLFESKSRYFATKEQQVSDLACIAAYPILDQLNGANIDLLIFAAASSDLIEPATANIIQAKLGLACHAIDLKNACNSFVSAMQVASAYIKSGIYERILIVNGEKLSEVINFNPEDIEHFTKSLAGYTLGDAGAAVFISSKGHEIVYQKVINFGQHWELCTVKGGGSLAFRESDKYFFECETTLLKNAFTRHFNGYVEESFLVTGWEKSTLNYVITHQVSGSTCAQIANYIDVPVEKFIHTFADYGNTAAASIPLALYKAEKIGLFKSGDKILIIGLAAGISISVQLIIW